ncbi:MAG TPA: dienelactone hydrolase family protein [Thermoanaerobaculia bacterium]|nr:dienelactone hydrolase family protein [Thermoanaerobaculia bacterium]
MSREKLRLSALRPLSASGLALALCLGAACARDEGADDASYDERVAAEHAGDRPVPGAAGEATENIEVSSREVVYATVDGREVTGYLAYPAGAELRPDDGLPGLVVIHEWWGLNDNVETMARMFAQQGYEVLAVDLYGEATDDPDRARELTQTVDREQALDNLRQAVRYLRDETRSPRVGVLGWCFGGGWSLAASLEMPEELDATVVYYGRLVTERDELRRLGTPLLGIFGADDSSLPVAQVRRFEATLEELGKDAEIHLYEGAGHAFANPSGDNYRPDASQDAWDETLAFLAEHLQDSEAETG